jgi:hypothetical protein
VLKFFDAWKRTPKEEFIREMIDKDQRLFVHHAEGGG